MNYYFEVANLSYEIISEKFTSKFPVKISDDISEYITNQITSGNRHICCMVNFINNLNEMSPIEGTPIYQDPYRIILKQNNGKEARIFLANPNSMPYASYKEIDCNKIEIECSKHIFKENIWDMRLLELFCFEKDLLLEQAFILHACYIEYQGEAIVFTAPSGTGKSTQGMLWAKNENARIINGDRCIIQKRGNNYFACGTPFCGSSAINTNCTLPLKAIAIVSQNPFDYVVKASRIHAVTKLNAESTINRWNSNAISENFNLLEDLYLNTEVVNLFCTPTKKAVKVLKHYLYDEITNP